MTKILSLSDWLSTWERYDVEVLAPPAGLNWSEALGARLSQNQAKQVLAMCKYRQGGYTHDPGENTLDTIDALQGFVALHVPGVYRPAPLLSMDSSLQSAITTLIGRMRVPGEVSSLEDTVVQNSLFCSYLAFTRGEESKATDFIRVLTTLQGLWYSPRAGEHLARILRLCKSIISAEEKTP